MASANLWLTAVQFAELASINRRNAMKALARAQAGKYWNGWPLLVQSCQGAGGRSGLRYEVALSSLPEALQKAFNEQETTQPASQSTAVRVRQPDTRAKLAHVSGSVPAARGLAASYVPHVPRVATAAQSQHALAIFRQIEPATHDGLSARQRGRAVRQIVETTGLPRKTVYSYLARYREHGLEGLMRKRPANAGQARCAVSNEFDRAFVAAGHPADMLPDLGAFVDETLKGLWKGRAGNAGENDLGALANFLLFRTLRGLGRAHAACRMCDRAGPHSPLPWLQHRQRAGQ
ncbi:MAG: helix-turn-helix domain-containing protein [Sphingomonas sp.]